MTRPLVYISGAITGTNLDERMLFHTTAKWLSAHNDYDTFNPLDMDIPEADTRHTKWQQALARDVTVIASDDCIGICALETFERSKGALFEIFIALTLGRKIILGPGQDELWIAHVTEIIRSSQSVLWMNVDALRYAHHSDINIPSVQPPSESHA